MGFGRSAWSAVGVVVLGCAVSSAANSCALNPQPEPPVTDHESGGRAGSGGSGGGLNTGTGGSSAAGGGSSGAGGTSSGSGGAGGAGTPDAGVGDAGPPPSDGGLPPDYTGCVRAPQSTCTPDQTCEALGGCGTATSLLDSNACPRSTCTADADCRAGERCLPTSLVTDCVPAQLDHCSLDATRTCQCTVSSECAARTQCVAESVAPRDQDCAVTGLECDALARRAEQVGAQLQTELAGPLIEALEACRKAIQAERKAGSCVR